MRFRINYTYAGCESWIKKAEHQRTDAFELWYWGRLLRVPWTSRRTNQSILKEISSENSLEGLMLKLHYFGNLMWKTDSLEESLMLGKIEGKKWRDDRRWDGWRASLTQWTWVWANSVRLWRTGKSGVLQSMGFRRVGHNWVSEWQSMFSYRSLHTYTHTPIPNYVFLQSLVGCRLWGHTESTRLKRLSSSSSSSQS